MTIVGVELEEIALAELPDDDAISGALTLRSSVARAFVTTATAPKAATQATAAPTATACLARRCRYLPAGTGDAPCYESLPVEQVWQALQPLLAT